MLTSDPTDHWDREVSDRWPAVAKLSDRVEVDWFKPVPAASLGSKWRLSEEVLPVSDPRTIVMARIRPTDGSEPFIAVSMYARWLGYHPFSKGNSNIHSDASMHRIISDVSQFIRHHDPSRHRILLAGDMNAFYGEIYEKGDGKPYREVSAFERLDRLGMQFLGPQQPNGRQSERVDDSIGPNTKNVATYRTAKGKENQLDYVFASRGFHESVRTRALNEVDEWGSSDHCRIWIEVDSR